MFAPFGLNKKSIYGEDIVVRLINIFIDFMGLSSALGTPSCNESWWYVSFALLLILVFPILINVCQKYGVLLLLGEFLLIRMLNLQNTSLLYLFPVIAGIIFAQNDIFEKIVKSIDKKSGKIIGIICALILLIFFSYFHNRIYFLTEVFHTGATICIAALSVLLFTNIPVIGTAMEYIGKHSMNMYFVHSFVKYYYFRDFSYSFRYPLLIIFVLVIDTLIFSIVLEKIKKIISLTKFEEMITKRIMNWC